MSSRWIVACCLSALHVLTAPGLFAQESLAWKFESGEALKYNVTQGTDMQMDLSGQKQNLSMTQQMDMVWKINDVSSDGTTTMAQIVERVQMKSEGGPFGTVQFDSSSEEVPESKVVKAMAEVFKKIVGQEFVVTMMPTGKINDVVVPESLLAQLKRTGAAGDALNEGVLKQMMTQSAITLPDRPIRKGDSWDSNQRIEMDFGIMNVDSKLTYNGTDASTGLAEIAMKPVVSVKPREGNPIALTVISSAGDGTVLFDAAKGRIAKSDLDLTLDLVVKQFGTEVKMSLRQKTAMQLAP